MKVLHVIPAVAARYGGPSAAIIPMARALADAGVETLVATTDADGGGRLDTPLGVPACWQGVPVIFFRRSFSEAYKYSPSLASWLQRNVAAFDLVHIHAVLSHACVAAAAACARHSVPYIVRPLGTLAPWSLRQKPLRKRLWLAFRGAAMLRRAAALHYTSAQEQFDVERNLRVPQGFVVPLGVDDELIHTPVMTSAVREREPYILALSRIHPKKNLEALIRAFVGAAPSGTTWRLLIAGDGEPAYIAALQRLAREMDAADRVLFLGWVDGDRKRTLVRGASLFALCSKHENFGVAVLDALAAGVPAIVTRHVDLGADIERSAAGWVVDLDDRSLQSALAQAMADTSERELRGRAARALAAQFAWPNVAARLVERYRSVAVQHRSRDRLLDAAAAPELTVNDHSR